MPKDPSFIVQNFVIPIE